MSAAGGDVFAPQPLVDRDRGVNLAHDRRRAAGEAPAPHLIGIAIVRLIVLLLALWPCPGAIGKRPRRLKRRAAEAQSGKGVDRSRKGKAAPATVFKDPDGKDVSVAAFKGKPVLVNLWATWCAPCVKELPTIEALAAATATASSRSSRSARTWANAPRSIAFLAGKKLGRFAAYPRSGNGACRSTWARRCCRRQSCSTPRARKFGATPATSTGPGAEAQKLLAEAAL